MSVIKSFCNDLFLWVWKKHFNHIQNVRVRTKINSKWECTWTRGKHTVSFLLWSKHFFCLYPSLPLGFHIFKQSRVRSCTQTYAVHRHIKTHAHVTGLKTFLLCSTSTKIWLIFLSRLCKIYSKISEDRYLLTSFTF